MSLGLGNEPQPLNTDPCSDQLKVKNERHVPSLRFLPAVSELTLALELSGVWGAQGVQVFLGSV